MCCSECPRSAALFVSLGIRRSHYPKHEFAHLMYILSGRMKASNTFFLCKLTASFLDVQNRRQARSLKCAHARARFNLN